MTHEDIGPDGLTYIENLQNILLQYMPVSAVGAPTPTPILPYSQSVTPAFLGSFYNVAGGNLTVLNDFFSAFNKTGNPLPTTLPALINSFLSYALSRGINAGIAFGTVLSGFQIDYRMGMGDPNNQSNDWSAIQPTPSVQAIMDQGTLWYADFLEHYPYKADGSLGNSNDFYANLAKALTLTAGITLGSTLYGVTPIGGNFAIPTSASFPRFQSVYNLFFPTGGAAGFTARVSKFYHDEIAEKGYFVPSQLFEKWTQTMIKESLGFSSMPGDRTSLGAMGARKTIIMDQIYALIAALVGSMQRVAAVQAARLTVLTQWQGAYTDELSKIHNFLAGDGTYLAGAFSDTDRDKARSELNTTANASIRDQLQSNRAIIGDDAKSLQSNVNQSNDAVSQQSNAATAIIQELNTILGAIFR